jgi:hypothetical protein
VNRRAMLRLVGVSGAAVVLAGPTGLAAAGAADLMRPPKPKPLPIKSAGDVLTAGSWNDLVARVNALTEAQ